MLLTFFVIFQDLLFFLGFYQCWHIKKLASRCGRYSTSNNNNEKIFLTRGQLRDWLVKFEILGEEILGAGEHLLVTLTNGHFSNASDFTNIARVLRASRDLEEIRFVEI